MILVTDTLMDAPEIKALSDKGHKIMRLSEVGHYASDADTETADLILGPNCWRMDERLIKYLDLAIKAARGVKYPKKGVASGASEARPTSVGGRDVKQG